MTIKFQASGSGKGYGDYVLREHKRLSKEERSKITELSGDMKLGDEIVKSSNYKDNAFNIVLGFKGSITKAEAKAVLEDFEKLFMYGFSKEEYHLNAVLHQDTDNDHIHIRIPKKNLLTDTTLRLYMDKVDRERVNLIRDYLEIKHNLERVQDNRKIVQDKTKEQIIQQHRAERGQEPFNFSKKKGRDKAQNYIVDYIAEVHEAGLINSIDDVKRLVEDLELEFVRSGHDFKTDTHYLTFKNETGKISLKGELFNERFYREFTREARKEQIKNNTNTRKRERGAVKTLQELEGKLEKSLHRRYEEVKERYAPARTRARERIRRLQDKKLEEAERRDIQRQWKIHSHNLDATSHNGVSSLSNIQGTVQQPAMDSTKRAKKDSRRRQATYSHTIGRYTSYRGRQALLYPDKQQERGLNGTTRRTNQNHRTNTKGSTRERTSSYERFREARESLYEQAQTVMRDRANRERARERIREAISKLGNELQNIQNEVSNRSHKLIESIKRISRVVEQRIERKNKQHEPSSSWSYSMGR
jgi:hypothetical protein